MGQPQLPSDLWDCRRNGMWLWSSHSFCHSFGESCNCSGVLIASTPEIYIYMSYGLRFTGLHGLWIATFALMQFILTAEFLQIALFLNGWPHGSHHSERFTKVWQQSAAKMLGNQKSVASTFSMKTTEWLAGQASSKLFLERHSNSKTESLYSPAKERAHIVFPVQVIISH